MPNQVLTVFTADAKELFQTADLVDARLAKVGQSPAVGAQSPIVPEQKAVTQAVAAESAKRIEAEKATTRAVIEESEKRIAAKKAEAAAIALIPISNYRNLVENQSVTSATTPFTTGKTPAQLLFESGASSARVNVGAQNLQRLAGFEKQILQQETADRLAGLKAQETGFSQYFRNLKALRAEDVAGTIAANRIETESTVAAAETQAVARRSSLIGRDALSIPLGGGLSSRVGLIGPAAIAIGATLAAVKLGVDAVESFQKANQADLALRATLEGTGEDFRKVSADAKNFAREHNQDISSINEKYVEFINLSKSSGKSIEEIGQAATDVASKRHLSDEQLVQGLKNIESGIADGNVLGASASTIFQEYARTHHIVGEALDDTAKKQAALNELVRQGALAAGDAIANTPRVSKLTTQIGNVAESANVGAGTLINYFIEHPSELIRMFGGNPLPLTPTLPEIDPKLKAIADAARASSIQQNQAEYQKALSGTNSAAGNAQQNIIDFALQKYVNKADFLGNDPDKAAKAKADAVNSATQVIESQIKAIATGFTINAGNVPELQRLKGQLNLEKNFIDPDKFKTLSDQASKAIDEGFRVMVDSASKSVPKLREIYKQVAISPDLLFGDKTALLRTINDQIEQAVNAGKAKVKELQSAYQNAFDSVASREGQRNGFLALLDSIDKRTTDLRRNLRGLPAEVKNALLARNAVQDSLDLSTLRFATRENALNLRDEAGAFSRFQLTGSTDSAEVASIKQTIKERGPDDPLYGDFFKKQLVDAQRRDVQNRLDAQIDIAKQSFLSGANPSAQARSLFNEEVIKLTPLDRADQFSRQELNQAIVSRQQEAKFQDDSEVRAREEKKERDKVQDKINGFILQLISDVEKGKGIPVDLGSQAVTVVEVTSPKLSVSKRSSTSTTKKSTADAMGQ